MTIAIVILSVSLFVALGGLCYYGMQLTELEYQIETLEAEARNTNMTKLITKRDVTTGLEDIRSDLNEMIDTINEAK